MNDIAAQMSSRIQKAAMATPKGAYDVAMSRYAEAAEAGADFQRDIAIETTILSNWDVARKYATYILKGGWPEFEESVAAADVEHDRAVISALLVYTREFVPGRWPEAERHIATDPDYSMRYAVEILGRPFELDHPAHATIMASARSTSYESAFQELRTGSKPILVR